MVSPSGLSSGQQNPATRSLPPLPDVPCTGITARRTAGVGGGSPARLLPGYGGSLRPLAGSEGRIVGDARGRKKGCLCRPPEHRQTNTLDSGRFLGVRAGLYRLLSWGNQGPAGAAQSSLRFPIDSMYRSSFPVSIESCFSGGISISKLVKSFMSIIWAVVPEMERTCADFRSTTGT